MAMFALMRI